MKQTVTVGAQLWWGGRYGCNNGRYGCTMVMSYIEINKAVSQWLLTFNLCVSVTWPLACAFHISCTHTPEIIDMHRAMCDNKKKPPCIGGLELVSLSCNHVFISAESVGRGWCKIAIATKWYQFHTADKCGFLFMPWITDQYTFVWYAKLINKIGTAVAKVITFSIMTT